MFNAFMTSYSTADVLSYTKLQPNALRGWVDARVIVPDVAADVGRGRERRYSYRNLFEAAVARELALYSVPTAQIRTALEWLRSLDGPQTRDVELAEAWTRLRSCDRPAAALLFYRPDAPFQLFIGGTAPLYFLNGRHSIIAIDLASICTALRVATGEQWPAELRRAVDDGVWASIQSRAEQFA